MSKLSVYRMRPEHELYVATDYRILYQDPSFLVVDKPAPLPVHPVGRFREKNLLSLLKKNIASGGDDLRIVNRLDSETSGLVLVGRSAGVTGKLGSLFEKRLVLKEYLAIVLGSPAVDRGTIEVPLGLKGGGVHNIRCFDANGQAAKTDYEVLRRMSGYSLLKVIPRTGRTHQIRVHLSLLGHPVAGDKIYIDPSVFERYIDQGWQEDMRPIVKSERLLLHASRLEFRHPESNEVMTFGSDLPACFHSFLNPGVDLDEIV
ncbi:MAG TPA: RluA family pseudouridine synthase [Candidatus Omnitrophota bacterium]|nr:RluA family pseudouridine synthase [Candidatus Omnitrophota bacterium]